MRLSIINIKDN